MNKYILHDGRSVVCEDVLEWGKWFETADRQTALDTFEGVRVSTVFLGLDHNFGFSGVPILYETMIFGGDHDGYQERYSTVEDAHRGHANAVRIAKGGIE